MLRQGPIPRFVHGVVEYASGALFIVAPFLFAFEADAATAVSIIVGVVVIFVAATTAGATSLVDQIPIPAHVVLDYLLAGFLIATPFLFAFSTETAPTAFFMAIGIGHLLLTIATRFLSEREPRAGTTAGRSGGSPPA